MTATLNPAVEGERELFPLPVTMGEISHSWLTAALRTRAPGVTVQDWAVLDVKHATCTKIRIRLEMDRLGRQAGIPDTVILKAGFEPHSRGMYTMHELEARFYRDIKPVLELPSPDCYFADFDPAVKQGIVIMEDLLTRGVKFCDPLVPHSYEQARRRLSSLAEYHAKSWNSSGFEPGGRWSWAPSAVSNFRDYAAALYLTPDAWQPWIDLPRSRATSVHFHNVEWARQALNSLVTVSTQLPRCFVQGDCHLGNLYEHPDGTPGFVDTVAIMGTPHCEISYYLGSALDQADRRDWERPLIKHYLEELARHGIGALDLDETMHFYGMFLAYGYIMFIINASEFQLETVNTAYASRFSSAMLDHGTMELLRAF